MTYNYPAFTSHYLVTQSDDQVQDPGLLFD